MIVKSVMMVDAMDSGQSILEFQMEDGKQLMELRQILYTVQYVEVLVIIMMVVTVYLIQDIVVVNSAQ